MGKGNGRMVRRYLDTGDAKSTGNLRKHAKICWGEEAVAAADSTRDVRTAREVLSKMKTVDSSITAAFERVGKGKATYSHRQHTTTEARAEIVRWVAESKRPFQIVNDRGFKTLMKTGRPGYHIPSAVTVSRDVRGVFVQVRKCIAKMLQVLSFSFFLPLTNRALLTIGSSGIRRCIKLRYRCLDVTKPPGLCRFYCSFRT